MTEVLLPDTEFAARAWARADPLLSPLLAGRVFFGYPAAQATAGGAVREPELPLMTVAELFEVPDPGPAVAASRLTWQVWGKDKQQASNVKRALVAALRGLRGTLLLPGVQCDGVDQITSVWAPNDEAKLARYVVDATMQVKAV